MNWLILIGYTSLTVAQIVSLYSIFALFYGSRKNNFTLLKNGRLSTYVTFCSVTLAFLLLLFAFITCNSELNYVTSHVISSMPLAYKISALWAGSSGSIMLWAWFLILEITLLTVANKQRSRNSLPLATAICMFIELVLISILIFVSNPFAPAESVYEAGKNVRLALMSPAMLIHPPLILSGYASAVVLFSLSISGLIQRESAYVWNKIIRRWSVIVWLLFSSGIACGSWWSYSELGWGGYWAWDPIENVGLMSWLLLTAFLHSQMLYKTIRSFQIWNHVLITAIFIATISGTILVRSGIVNSVHAYANTGQGSILLIVLLSVIIGSIAVIFFYIKYFKDQQYTDGLSQNQGIGLAISSLLIVAAYLIFLGIILPYISSWIAVSLIQVEKSYYTYTIIPVFLIIILLLSTYNYYDDKFHNNELRRRLFISFMIAVIVGLLAYFSHITFVLTLIALSICSFALTSLLYVVIKEIIHFISHKFEKCGMSIFSIKNVPYLNIFIINVSIIIIAVSITGSSEFKEVQKITMQRNTITAVGDYSVEYIDNRQLETDDYIQHTAIINIWENGRLLATMEPRIIYQKISEHMYSRVAIKSTMKEDIYIILTGFDGHDNAMITLSINPLIIWLWIGFALLSFGGLLFLFLSFNED